MENGMWVSEFWLDHRFIAQDFIDALKFKLPGSSAVLIKVVDEVVLGHDLYHLHVPYAQKHLLQPFLDEYARVHGAIVEPAPQPGFPFNPGA